MRKRRPGPAFSGSSASTPRKPPLVTYLLEHGKLGDVRRSKKYVADYLKYQWEYFSELAHQRNQIFDDLKNVLIESSIGPFRFEKWQRIVKWKYSLHPLSTTGSLTFVGGRFNAGVDISSAISSFPALYLAVDKDTALQEVLGMPDNKKSTFSALELALTNSQSITAVSVSGELDKVFDLRSKKNLDAFVGLTKQLTLSPGLRDAAKRLKLIAPTVAQTSKQLLETLLTKDWRIAPVHSDVPANSQIFGQLVQQAGVEGIVYPSRQTGKDCLAIFPVNFAVTSSYIELDDEPPHANVPRRIDGNNWRVCEMMPKTLIDGTTTF